MVPALNVSGILANFLLFLGLHDVICHLFLVLAVLSRSDASENLDHFNDLSVTVFLFLVELTFFE